MLRDKIGENLQGLRLGQDILDLTTKAKSIKGKTYKSLIKV